MAGKPKYDWDALVGSDEQFMARWDRVGSTQMAKELGVSRGAIDSHRRSILGISDRKDVNQQAVPGVHKLGDESAVVISEPGVDADWESLLDRFGVDREKFEVVRVRVNEWGDPPQPQVRVDLIPREYSFSFPSLEGYERPKGKKPKRTDAVERVIFCGDHHAPHHDRNLHRLFCEWLSDEQPEYGVINGDLLDAATVSRHRPRDGWSQGLTECVQEGFNILVDYQAASPNTEWVLLPGNHDARIQNAVLDNLRGLHNLRAADDEVPVLSLRRLLHLDELGIEYVDADWEHAKTPIAARLFGRHGFGSATNQADKVLRKYAKSSTLMGHSHRLSMTFRSEHDDLSTDGHALTVRMAAEAGCMANITEEGLGYAPEPDWQNGALLSWVYPSGDFLTAPLVYVAGRLLAPGGRRYE